MERISFEGIVTGGLCWNRLTEERLRDPRALENYGYKVYSQNDEDGIIHEIFNRIGTESKEFVEFGVQNGLECNSHYLMHCGWHGLWMEGEPEAYRQINIKFKPAIKKGILKVSNVFIDKDNIDGLINRHRNCRLKNGEEEPLDFLSIDIDGNDWYVWDSIKSVRPRLVCIEYNGKFPPDCVWKQAYNAKHLWDGSDWQGASLKALELLGREKGYTLVAANLNGVNAFFVRNDLYSEELFGNKITAEELYNPYRRRVLFIEGGHIPRYGLIGQEDSLGILNYYDSMEEYREDISKERR